MSNWNVSNYRAHKAKKAADQKPEWVEVPSGVKFLLRRVGAMAAMIANHMQTVPSFADGVVSDWKAQGLEVGNSSTSRVSSEMVSEAERDLKMMARIVGQACVIPKLTSNPTAEDEIDPAELDDDDVLFIFRWATGQTGEVKGGEMATMGELSQFPKQRGSSRVRANAKKQRDSSESLSRAS